MVIMRGTSERECSLLQKYASNAKFGIVEIGVFDGDNLVKLAEVSSVPVYGIDPIIPDSMPPYDKGDETHIIQNISRFGHRVVFIKDYSFNVIETFSFPFDFIFVDGSHLYSDVAKDFLDWFPKLKSLGYIAFHDSAPREDVNFQGWPGPIQLTHEIEITGNIKFIERVDTIKVFEK
jgi:hypothetical protein